MISPLLQSILVAEGKGVRVSGNAPFFLLDEESVWWVERGGLELFSVHIIDGEPAGTRQPFCSLRAGEAVFGLGPPVGGRALLAVGLPDTQLRCVPRRRIRALAGEPELTSEIAHLVDGWIEAVSQGVSRDFSPRTDCLLTPAARQEIPAHARFRSRRGVLWLEAEAGDLLFIGLEELALTGQALWFPVTQDSWLQALGAARVRTHVSGTAIDRDELWDGLAFFLATVGKCEAVNRRLREVDDLNRQKDRADASARATTRALDDLAAVLVDAPPLEHPVDDALFQSCLLLGHEQGIAFRPPPELLKGEPLPDPIAAIARASRVRVRRVDLSTLRRMRESVAPLLVFLRDGQRPAVLTSLGPGEYLLQEPDREPQRVNTAIVGKLEPFAFLFYRPLGETATTGWTLLRFAARGLRPDATCLLLAGIAGGVLGTLPAFAVTIAFDHLVPLGARGLMAQLAFGLVALAGATAIFELTRGLALLRLEGRLDHVLQASVLDRLLRLPLTFFRRYAAGDLAQRLEGVAEIRRLASAALLSAGLGSLFAWVNFIVLFAVAPGLALIVGGLLALALGATALVLARQLRAQRAVAAQHGRITGLVLEFINGISKLRVAAAEELAFSVWARCFAQKKRDAFRARRLGNQINLLNAVFPLLGLALLFWCVARPRGDAALPVGQFLAFNTAFTALLAAWLALTNAAAFALQAVPLFERVKPILLASPEDFAAKHDPGALTGRIELSHVSFRYAPELPLALDNVSLELAPGEFVAIVGASGSGKSTLLRLLLGFETPQNGAILYDGQDLAKLDVAAVRRQVGVVLQSSQLAGGSLFENIVGSRPFLEADAWEALRLAGLEDDVRALPMGLRTVVPAGGGVLSGGQRQRLMIARALIGRPRILLFDEATSALDNRAQAVVRASLAQLQATRLVIAHRLSTIRHADRIVVLEDGRIVETGTYDALAQAAGRLAHLARRQLHATAV